MSKPSTPFGILSFAFVLAITGHSALTQSGFRANIVAERTESKTTGSATIISVYQISGGGPVRSLNVGDRVVVCVILAKTAYFSLWDTPPNGQVERLFPNPISHPNGERGAHLQRKQEKCVGEAGSGFNIEIPHDEGTGIGWFYVLALDDVNQLPSANEFRATGLGANAVPEADIGNAGRVEKVEDYFAYTVLD